MRTSTIYLWPAYNAHSGTGHLRRCLRLAHEKGFTLVWDQDPVVLNKILKDYGYQSSGIKVVSNLESLGSEDVLVVDRRRTTSSEYFKAHGSGAFLLGLDEGGPKRKKFPYLLDTLGNLASHRPNLNSPGMGTSVNPVVQDQQSNGVLVSFGGQDPKDLTGRLYKFWKKYRLAAGPVTVVIGPGFKNDRDYPGWRVLRDIKDLRTILPSYQTLITSYGLSSYEAQDAGCKVLHLDPTRYHRKLSQGQGFSSFGVVRPNLKAFNKGWEAPRLQIERNGSLPKDLGNFLDCFSFTPSGCPVCGSPGVQVLARYPQKTYYQCKCSMVWMGTFNQKPKVYEKDYFDSEYKNQYGKTYLEDFEHIKSMGKIRSQILWNLLGKSGSPRILDAGCAYGPFLSAAKDLGFRPYGLDVAEAPVEYVRGHLGFPAMVKSLADLDWEKDFPGEGPLDALSLWYVIEHFSDLNTILETVGRNLRPEGVFGFSTPHGKGITGRLFPNKFFKESPDDHYTVWDVSIARKVLGRYGFRVDKIRITGHHPERFPGFLSAVPLRPFTSILSRLLGLGDTFEVYCTKAGPS